MTAVRVLLSCFLFVLLSACGGGNNDNPRNNPPPSSNPTPPAADPCASTDLEAGDRQFEQAAPDALPRKRRGDVDRRGHVLDSLWLHESARVLGLTQPLAVTGRDYEDIGDVAVLQDSGDLIVRPNAFDLAGRGLLFTRTGSGYDVARTEGGLRASLGNGLTLEDDASSAFAMPFAFALYGRDQTRAFVNSDGNITFEEEDFASTDRSVSRFLSGPPRVSPFFADLDPSTGSGRVFLFTSPDGVTVTWCNVRGFETTDQVTVQTTLLPGGHVEMRYGSPIRLRDAVIGLSPGRTGQFTTADLSAGGIAAPGGTAVGERFSAEQDLDLVAVARKFYQSHTDTFDQIVVWTDTSVVSGNTFAFETTIANEVRGIGTGIFDSARDFGSGGRLRSVVLMDALAKYPATPTQRFLGENSTLSLLAHETGHRWLALLRFRQPGGGQSDDLLGRDRVHWSFFFDSDGSVMEGNDIEDLRGGSFRTRGAVNRYSLLDQYAMGLVGPSQVPPVFYVESPVNVQPDRNREDAPDVGVTFSGTRREVRIEDIIEAMGRREPSTGSSPKVHRQAFIYVVSNGRTTDPGQVAKLDRIRREWPEFFRNATTRRMSLETALR